MRSTDRAARLAVALAMAIGAAACGVAPGPTTIVPRATPSPTRDATGSFVPTPVPTPTPPPAGLADWQQVPAQDSLRGAEFNSVTWVGDRFLGLGCVANQEGCIQPAIWESIDGLEWRTAGPVFLPPDASSGTVLAAASTRIGTIAAGSVRQDDKIQASIWLRGAEGWVQVTPQSASDTTVSALFATPDARVIAVGSGAFTHFSGFRAWWSSDGTTWAAAPSVADQGGGYPTDLLPVGTSLLAWGHSCGDVCPVLPTAWWQSPDGTAWQPVGPPRGLEDANVTAVGRTDGGFIAFGTTGSGDQPVEPAAWTADETAAVWQAVEPPAQPDATTISDHIPIGHGSVVAGTGPPGPGRDQPTGLVWLRGLGESAWRPPATIPDVGVLALIQHPQQLNRVIVLGQTFDGLQGRLVIWTGTVEWAP